MFQPVRRELISRSTEGWWRFIPVVEFLCSAVYHRYWYVFSLILFPVPLLPMTETPGTKCALSFWTFIRFPFTFSDYLACCSSFSFVPLNCSQWNWSNLIAAASGFLVFPNFLSSLHCLFEHLKCFGLQPGVVFQLKEKLYLHGTRLESQ